MNRKALLVWVIGFLVTGAAVFTAPLHAAEVAKGKNVKLEARTPPIYELDDLVSAINKSGGLGIYVDARLAHTKLWVSCREKDLTVDRLMTLMAQTTGWAWRKVGETQILVEDIPGYALGDEGLMKVVIEEESLARNEMFAFLPKLWLKEDPLPLKQCVQEESTLPWSSLPLEWREVIRKGLRKVAEQTNDDRMAKFLWAPNGLKHATVNFSAGVIAVVATPPPLHPPGYYWGVITEGITVERPSKQR